VIGIKIIEVKMANKPSFIYRYIRFIGILTSVFGL